MKIKSIMLGAVMLCLTGCSTPGAGYLADWATNISNEPTTDPNIPNAALGKGYNCTPLYNNYVLADWCIDPKSIQNFDSVPGAKQADLKLDFANDHDSSNAGYITSMQTNVFNCKAGTMGVLQYTYYTTSGAVWQQQTNTPDQVTFATPDPSTIGAVIMQSVCGH